MGPVLVVGSLADEQPDPVSREAVRAGRTLAATTGSQLHLAIPETASTSDSLRGVDHVYRVALDSGAPSRSEKADSWANQERQLEALDALQDTVAASYLLASSHADCHELYPALARRIGGPFCGHVTAFEHGSELRCHCDRPELGVETTVTIDTTPAVFTVRGGSWLHEDTERADGDEPSGQQPTQQSTHSVSIGPDQLRSAVTAVTHSSGTDLEEARMVVGVGRGVSRATQESNVRSLLDATGAALAATGPVVSSWGLSDDRLVGDSGTRISPELYLALGLSGAIQHRGGMADSDTVVAVNTDPEAPIFDIADYGIQADLDALLPALVEAVSQNPE